VSRVGDPDAVDVAGRDAEGAGEAHEQRVQVRALAPEILRLEHGLDVAEPASPDLRVPERVLDDPLVEGAGLLHVRAGRLRDLARRRLDDPIRPDELRGLEVA